MGIGFQRESESAGKAEISELDVGPFGVYEQIAWLQVTMHDTPLMAVDQALEYLKQELFNARRRQWSAVLVKILFQVEVYVLKDEVQLVTFR
jgi:hypothetical protein